MFSDILLLWYGHFAEDDALVPASPKHTPPVMGVETEKVVTVPQPQPNLLIMLDDDNKDCDNNTVLNSTEDVQSSTPIFIRYITFWINFLF